MRLKVLLPVFFYLFTAAQSFAQVPPPCPSGFSPGADRCSGVCVTCTSLDGYANSTAGYTQQNVANWCGTIENEQWLAFVAGGTTATFEAAPSNCSNGDGIQIALYQSCDAGGPIECNGGAGGLGNTPVSITTDKMVPGQLYYLVIDGFAGDQCDFILDVTPPTATVPVNVGPIGQVQGPSTVCPGGVFVFSVPPVANTGFYTWTAPAGATINGLTNNETISAADGGHEVTVTFGQAGGNVCARVGSVCQAGTNTACKPVTVQPIPPTTWPPITICYEDAPYYLPSLDILVSTSGTYSQVFTSFTGCDSVVRQQVIVKPPLFTNLGLRSVCRGGSFSVCGEFFDQPGQYSAICESWQGCDSLVSFALTVLEPFAFITATDKTITCTQPTITLNSAASSGIKTWKNAQGNPIGTGNSLTVSDMGLYRLEVTQTQGGTSCTSTDDIFVRKNVLTPSLTASGGTLTPQNPTVRLNASSVNSPVRYSWVGPNGFTSNLRRPTVGVPGFYTVTVTNTQTGCTNSKTVEVSQ